MVHDEIGDDADAAAVRGVEQFDEIVDGAELGQHLVEVADVVAAVAQRRVVERRQPKTVDAKPLQVVELFGQPTQVTAAVGVGVVERPHQHLVEHRTLEPGAVLGQGAGVTEVFGGGVFDHAVLDVAALRRIVYRVFDERAQWSISLQTYPCRDEIESLRVSPTLLSKDGAGGVKDRLNPQSNRVTVSATWIRQRGDLAINGVSSTNRVAVADSTPNDGEAPVIVGLSDAAMHMYAAAIDTLPDPSDPEFPTARA